MARKKPASGKARKVQLQTKRAQKKANITPTPHPADEHLPSSSRQQPATLVSGKQKPSAVSRVAQQYRTPEQRERDGVHAGRMQLESRFIRLSKGAAELHRERTATEVLPRPIPEEAAELRAEDFTPAVAEGEEELSCPKRPKWNYKLSKLELEKNEEGVFKKWLAQTDEKLAKYGAARSNGDEDNEVTQHFPLAGPSRSPTFYERNLNVWRQLWRTVEQSDILCVLVDVRFPLLHYPPSLKSYLRTLKPPRPVVLVLTKTDLVPPSHSEAWKKRLEDEEGPDGAQVVLMESYREAETREETQGRTRFVPAAPPQARLALVDALRAAHSSLLTPPPIVASDPAKLARWSPKCRREVEWELVESEGGETGVHAALEEGERERKKGEKGKRRKGGEKGKGKAGEEGEEEEEEGGAEEEGQETGRENGEERPFLSVGLIGQPNVGKSSLLNALLNKKVVRASRTPGKTKTLQTIYWNTHLRLVDCPGLVCPSSAGFERQVLGGILPIQNIEPVIHFIGQRLPLEKVLRLRHPEEDEEERVDEFAGRRRRKELTWTTDDVLVAYALQQGFVTAKGGRPDIYRAGASILRLLHSSLLPWGFRPPLSEFESWPMAQQEGIWFVGFVAKAASAPLREGASEDDEEEEEDDGSEEGESEEEDSADERAVQAVRGAFAALAVEEGEDDSEEEEGSGSGASADESGSGEEEGSGSGASADESGSGEEEEDEDEED